MGDGLQAENTCGADHQRALKLLRAPRDGLPPPGYKVGVLKGRGGWMGGHKDVSQHVAMLQWGFQIGVWTISLPRHPAKRALHPALLCPMLYTQSNCRTPVSQVIRKMMHGGEKGSSTLPK